MRQSKESGKATKKLKKNVIRDDSDDDEDVVMTCGGQVKKGHQVKQESKAEEQPSQGEHFSNI